MEKICVVGLGYVGLPLALEFSKKFKDVIGFDINSNRINELKKGIDITNEISKEKIINSSLTFITNPQDIRECSFIIVTVPTPIKENKNPDLTFLEYASQLVGENLSKGSIVVFESTVYPGVTEEICKPILEKQSKLICGVDFKIGYSPERINPGDKEHTIDKIVKVVSGMDEESLNRIYEVYLKIIKVGVFKAKNIQIAEAAKMVENIQRDINIALMNELKIIFDKKNIDIKEVLKTAGTKWNFLNFSPGLVGGHCIGVDPYYLAYESTRKGIHPEIILAGRKINDNMPFYETKRLIKKLIDKGHIIKEMNILILGITFKPNISDFRNSKIKDVINELKKHGCSIKVCDPLVKEKLIFNTENILLEDIKQLDKNTICILCVKHEVFNKYIKEIKYKFKEFYEII